MDLGIAGRRALVMASSRGLGRGIAEALAAEGVHVLVSGRNAERLAEVTAGIEAKGGRASYVVADLAEPASVDALAGAVETHLGHADILVANTGGPPPGRMVEADFAVLETQWQAMVMRVATLAQRLLPAMRAQKWGRIVAVASSGVVQPIPNLALSNMIRSALVGWAKSLSNDVAAEGVTVNMLLPGRIHTERVDELDAAAAKRTGTSLDEAREAARAQIPAGRYGEVEEFAAVAAFLASERAAYVTGSQVRCDGGLIRSV